MEAQRKLQEAQQAKAALDADIPMLEKRVLYLKELLHVEESKPGYRSQQIIKGLTHLQGALTAWTEQKAQQAQNGTPKRSPRNISKRLYDATEHIIAQRGPMMVDDLIPLLPEEIVDDLERSEAGSTIEFRVRRFLRNSDGRFKVDPSTGRVEMGDDYVRF